MSNAASQEPTANVNEPMPVTELSLLESFEALPDLHSIPRGYMATCHDANDIREAYDVAEAVRQTVRIFFKQANQSKVPLSNDLRRRLKNKISLKTGLLRDFTLNDVKLKLSECKTDAAFDKWFLESLLNPRAYMVKAHAFVHPQLEPTATEPVIKAYWDSYSNIPSSWGTGTICRMCAASFTLESLFIIIDKIFDTLKDANWHRSDPFFENVDDDITKQTLMLMLFYETHTQTNTQNVPVLARISFRLPDRRVLKHEIDEINRMFDKESHPPPTTQLREGAQIDDLVEQFDHNMSALLVLLTIYDSCAHGPTDRLSDAEAGALCYGFERRCGDGECEAWRGTFQQRDLFACKSREDFREWFMINFISPLAIFAKIYKYLNPQLMHPCNLRDFLSFYTEVPFLAKYEIFFLGLAKGYSWEDGKLKAVPIIKYLMKKHPDWWEPFDGRVHNSMKRIIEKIESLKKPEGLDLYYGEAGDA
ncbi:hypothetical protein JNB11_00010 [Kocuria palustris]|nr:hypothetical protein [Kocuria palustris]